MKAGLFFLFFCIATLTFAQEDSAQTDTAKFECILGAQELPQFPGGETAFFKFLHDNLSYQPADTGRFTGKAYVSYYVETDGSLSEIKFVKGDSLLGMEMVRILSGSPKWSPGRSEGKPVRMKIIQPIEVLPQ